jgi:hypothetical protein
MSDEMMNHGHPSHETEFEHEDLGTRGIYAFMIGLVVSGVVIYFIIVGMYSFLDKYERSQMTTASPLVTSSGAMTRVMTQDEVDKLFKENGAPMLENNERGQFRDFLMDQEGQLNSYGWVDEKAGVARIPIERAMELTVQRGLPVYSQSGADARTAQTKTTTASKAAAPKAVGKGKGSAK